MLVLRNFKCKYLVRVVMSRIIFFLFIVIKLIFFLYLSKFIIYIL